MTRRELLWGALAAVVEPRPVVSIAQIRRGHIGAAVEEAIELIGGAAAVARGKRRVMLKPNLLSESPRCTTKLDVVRALARLFVRAGKEVSIGEGSAAALGFNVTASGQVFRTQKQPLIDRMQAYVFEKLGYAQLAKDLGLPLVNLHSGPMATVSVPGGLAYRELSLHQSLAETDLLCSVPMMKTHALAMVTLGMKNLIGLYPGTVYGTVRAGVHDHAADAGSPGVAYEILDMVRASRLGLVVVDGSTAMEGNGPTLGKLVDMNVIVAGTNPLAADMVAAALMGIEPHEVATFTCAWRAGMTPRSLADIEIRGASVEGLRRPFARPRLYSWREIRNVWGVGMIS